jgi:hypothetical protein
MGYTIIYFLSVPWIALVFLLEDFAGWLKGIVVFIALLLLIPCFLSIRMTSTVEGKHTGFVTAVQQTGIIWKNYRVYVKTDNQSSQEDIYCLPIEKKELADKLVEASETRKLITVKYNGYWFITQSFNRCNGDEIYEFEYR